MSGFIEIRSFNAKMKKKPKEGELCNALSILKRFKTDMIINSPYRSIGTASWTRKPKTGNVSFGNLQKPRKT